MTLSTTLQIDVRTKSCNWEDFISENKIAWDNSEIELSLSESDIRDIILRKFDIKKQLSDGTEIMIKYSNDKYIIIRKNDRCNIVASPELFYSELFEGYVNLRMTQKFYSMCENNIETDDELVDEFDIEE